MLMKNKFLNYQEEKKLCHTKKPTTKKLPLLIYKHHLLI